MTPYPATARRSRLLSTLAVVALASLLGACGGGSSGGDASSGSAKPTEAPASAPDGGGGGTGGGSNGDCAGEIYQSSVCATVAITGNTTASGTAAAPVAAAATAGGTATCAEWAEGADGKLRLPLFLEGLDDGTVFGLESLITDYTGPGTSSIDQLSGEGADFTIVIGDERYQPDPEGTSTAEVTVEADGSGSLRASGFKVDDGAGTLSPPIDAEVTWTCTDA